MFCLNRNHWMKFPLRVRSLVGFMLLALATITSQARNNSALLVLPALEYVRAEPGPDSDDNKADTRASLDMLYAFDYGQFRLFSEFVVTNNDKNFGSDLARLHLGWESRSGTTTWLGRFQMNQGYWNKTFHFRNYIQPTILAPGIAAYEKEGGAIPTHFSGIASRHQWTLGGSSSLQLEGGFGAGAKQRGRLWAHDLLDPDGGRKPSTSVRLSYSPDQDNDNEIGLFFVSNHIAMKNAPFSQNDQRVAGGFVNWNIGKARMIASLYRISNDVKTTSGRDNQRFTTGFLQGQYRVDENWLPYVRIEDSHGEKNDPYVALFPRFVRKRTLAGLRWGFLGNQALKIEYADTDFLNQDSNQWAVQWSMILP